MQLGIIILLGCTPKVCQDCACPVSRPKEEARVSNKDINGLMDRGATYPEQGPGATRHGVADGGQDMAAREGDY